MKKVFLGLLLVAAGTAIYFFIHEKKQPVPAENKQQELIIGKWEMDSVTYFNDSLQNFMAGILRTAKPNLAGYQYEFKKEGSVAVLPGDSLNRDSARYEWNNKGQLVWREGQDTSTEVFTVSIPHNDSMRWLSPDSAMISFHRIK